MTVVPKGSYLFRRNLKAQKPLIQETIKSLGHKCLFYPKFHCELNYIEYVFLGSRKEVLPVCILTINEGCYVNLVAH